MNIKELIKYKGVYHQIFGDLLNKIIFNKSIENEKDKIKALGFKDVDLLFPAEVDNNFFNKLSKIIFRFYENKDETGK